MTTRGRRRPSRHGREQPMEYAHLPSNRTSTVDGASARKPAPVLRVSRVSRRPTGSGRGHLPRDTLQPAAVRLPPGLVTGRHVVVALLQPDRPVDELPDDVGVAGVPV